MNVSHLASAYRWRTTTCRIRFTCCRCSSSTGSVSYLLRCATRTCTGPLVATTSHRSHRTRTLQWPNAWRCSSLPIWRVGRRSPSSVSLPSPVIRSSASHIPRFFSSFSTHSTPAPIPTCTHSLRASIVVICLCSSQNTECVSRGRSATEERLTHSGRGQALPLAPTIQSGSAHHTSQLCKKAAERPTVHLFLVPGHRITTVSIK